MGLEFLAPVDLAIAAILPLLAFWVILSGLDDAVIDGLFLFRALCERMPNRRNPRPPDASNLRETPEVPIAIVVPAWNESRVIARMVEQTVASLQYRRYCIFVGVYPNDRKSIEALGELGKRLPSVQLALCPHDGPTSKADCLNWIYQRILQYEAEHGERFEIVVTHDAEDVVHGEELRYINYYAKTCGMVQVPVLPVPTGAGEWTHGVYLDEFAEYQTKDMPVREFFGAFVPSTGVGTGFRRDALEGLAAAESNRIFEPTCLTEDYENGYRIHALGVRQHFVALGGGSKVVATRGYFPQSFRTAVKQRTRWVTGIALQTWERHGWGRDWTSRYWFWRDRKGLIGSPLSLALNLICLYSVLTWPVSRLAGQPWGLERAALPHLAAVLAAAFAVTRILARAGCTGRLYGWRMAATAPLRMAYGNLINAAAAAAALWIYCRARLRGEPLRWLKTEHAYPSLAALQNTRRRLGEVLVGLDYLSEERLNVALATKPASTRLGEHLVQLGFVSREALYEALSLQHGMPVSHVTPSEIKPSVARSLPAALLRKFKVLPFKIDAGRLFVAGPEAPSEELQTQVQRFTRLEVRFYLVTPENFAELRASIL